MCMLGGEKMAILSVVRSILTPLRKKHLKVSAVEPKMALDMKQAILSTLTILLQMKTNKNTC